jgi:hypothetical protein
MNAPTFQAEIIKRLTKTVEELEKTNPDTKSNTGRALGKAYLLGIISDYSDRQYQELMGGGNKLGSLREEKIVDDPSKLDPGEYVLAESPKFVVTCKVSEPRMSFDEDVFAALLKKKYKVPEAITKDFIQKSKTPGSKNKTIKILER